MGLFSDYALRPANVRFETQQTGEIVELALRQHLVVMVPSVLLIGVLVILPLLAWPMLIGTNALPFTIPANYIIVLTFFWYVVAMGFALASFMRWFFNIYLVSNKRIVDIDFVHMLYKMFSATYLSRIEDISYAQSGFLMTMLDYGNVYIQTAGTEKNFEFLNIPHPQSVVDTITRVAALQGAAFNKKHA